MELRNVGLKLQVEEKEIRILSEINLLFEKGKMYALTGPNGSGKSSLARVIMGIYTPTEGKILFEDRDITALSITERAKLGLGYAFQHPARFKGLKVEDLLEIAMSSGTTKWGKSLEVIQPQVDCQYLHNIGLCPNEYLKRNLDSSLSGGEIKRIEIATLLAQNPRFRILDEPEAGIDLWSFEQLLQVIATSHRPDTTTIIISHQEKILNMVDEIIIVAEGTVSLKGSQEAIWPQIRHSALCTCRQNCRKEEASYADCPR